MKKYLLLLFFATVTYFSQGQFTVIYENSFRNWLPGQGWVMLNNDSISKSPGMITRSVTAGVPVAALEMLDNMLGVAGNPNWLWTPDNLMGQCDKTMISPPLSLGSDPYAIFYSNHKAGSNFEVWVLANPNDTTINGLTTNVLSCRYDGFNVLNLNAWSNSTIRLAFRLRGLNTYGFIDNVKVLNKTSLASVPDNCFRAYLRTVVPGAFSGNDLDFLNPDVLNTRELRCPNSCIQSLEGIQYFPCLRYINFNNNLISYIPPSPYYYLDSVKMGNNLLPNMPDMPMARTVILSENLMHHIPNIFNQYADSLTLRNNSIYDCLPGTNRFVRGNFAGNVGVNFSTYQYYSMIFDHAMYPSNGPVICKDAWGHVKGKIFYDANQNGIYDAADYLIPNQRIDFYQSDYIFGSPLGVFSEIADTGLINMTITALPANFTCTNPLSTHLQTSEIIDHDFRIIASSSFNDLGIRVNATTSSFSSDILRLNLAARNYGTAQDSGLVKMYLPPGYTVMNVTNATIINDTVVWPVILRPFEIKNNVIQIQVNYPNLHTVRFYASLASSADVNPVNNRDSSNVTVFRPHDPNNKTVNTPQVLPGFSDYLDYTINFENVGSGNARRVMVRDFLSHKFDFSSFEMIGASHPYTLNWGHDSLPEITFYPITLTPRSIDSIHSHGNLWFRIKPLNPILANESIGNMASIYFDSESPVNTDICLVWSGDLHASFITTDTVQCGSEKISFIDKSPGTPLIRQWEFQGGTPLVSSVSNPQVKYDSTGTYLVKLIVSTAEYSDTLEKWISIVVATNPIATITESGSTSICFGDSVQLNAPAGTGYSYRWSNGDSVQTIYGKYGYYNVTVTDLSGCTASDYKSLNVFRPSPVISNASSCQNLTANLELNSAYSHYQWSTGDTTQSISVNQYGTYLIQVTDTHGCVGIDTFDFAFHSDPVPQIVGDSLTCSQTYILLQTSQSYSSYRWSNNATAQGIYVIAAGTYTVTVTDSNSCTGVDSFIHSTLPALYTNITGTRFICKGEVSTLDAGNGFSHYLWSTGETTQSINAGTGGRYSVSVTNSDECLTTAFFDLNVRDKYNLHITATDTGFCQGQNIHLSSQYNLGCLTASSAGCSPQTATIGTGTTLQSGSGTQSPGLFSNYRNASRSQLLYKAVELQTALGGPQLITQISFQIGTFNSSATLQNFTIKMGYTSAPQLISTWEKDLLEVFYAASFQPGTGWNNTFILNTPVYWDGISNLVIEICTYNPLTQGNLANKAMCSTTSFNSYMFKWDINELCGLDDYAAATTARPNIRFNHCTPLSGPVPIETPTFDSYSSGGNATIADIHAANTIASADSFVTFVLMVSDTSGCADVDSVTVNAGIANPVLLSASNNFICSGDSVQICASAGVGNFHWNTGATATCIKVHQAGIYDVIFEDGLGCTATNSVSIHGSAVDSVTVSPDNTTICPGDSVRICGTSTIISYLWNTLATTQCIATSTGGLYWVVLTDANNCSVESDHFLITANSLPVISANGNVLSTFNSGAYQWYRNDTVIPGANSASYAAMVSGDYAVQVLDTNGCLNFSNSINVILSEAASLLLSKTVQVIISPNPFSRFLHVEMKKENMHLAAITILDALGQSLYHKEERKIANSYAGLIDLSFLPNGVYFAILSIDGEIFNKKLLKEGAGWHL